MSIKKFEAGEYLFTEGNIPAYYLYRMKSGTVSIVEGKDIIKKITVSEKDSPVLLGVIALFYGRMHSASVKAETTVVAEEIPYDHINKAISDLSSEHREAVATMVKRIMIHNKIEKYRRELKKIDPPALEVPKDANEETKEVFCVIKDIHSASLP